jgi:hypothetical protein
MVTMCMQSPSQHRAEARRHVLISMIMMQQLDGIHPEAFG